MVTPEKSAFVTIFFRFVILFFIRVPYICEDSPFQCENRLQIPSKPFPNYPCNGKFLSDFFWQCQKSTYTFAMTTIIVDDEVQSQEVLKSLLTNHHADIQILATGNRVQEGVELVRKHRPDLVFLDVEMPDGKGFDLLKNIESPDFNVIFITAHEHYAIPAFRFGALDFLLKPIDKADLAEALKKARKRHQEKLALEQLQIFWETLDKLNERKLPTRISIATLEGIMYKPVSEIIRLEAQENYTKFFLIQEPKKILASSNLKGYEEQFKPYREFLRVHRSHLVNLLYVDRYVKAEGGYLILQNGDKVSVSKAYRDALQERLQKI